MPKCTSTCGSRSSAASHVKCMLIDRFCFRSHLEEPKSASRSGVEDMANLLFRSLSPLLQAPENADYRPMCKIRTGEVLCWVQASDLNAACELGGTCSLDNVLVKWKTMRSVHNSKQFFSHQARVYARWNTRVHIIYMLWVFFIYRQLVSRMTWRVFILLLPYRQALALRSRFHGGFQGCD